MAENSLPKKNVAFTFDVALIDSASRPSLRANPTLAAGDVQVDTDAGGFANITTLPVVTPASSVNVKVDLSDSEMNGDNVRVKFIDAAGGEWDDLLVPIRPATRKLEDLAFPLATGRGMDVAVTTGYVGADLEKWRGSIPSPISTGRVDTNVGAMQASVLTAAAIATDAITNAKIAAGAITSSEAPNLDAAISTRATPAQVLTQVNAALDTAISELGVGAPANTPTLRTGLMLLYMALLNLLKVDTSGTDALEIYNAAGTLIAKKLVTDDSTTYAEAKMVSG